MFFSIHFRPTIRPIPALLSCPWTTVLWGTDHPTFHIPSSLRNWRLVRDKYPNQIIPFVHIDPRHGNTAEKIQEWITRRNFMGVKIYAAFGYLPTHSTLEPMLYAFCENIRAVLPIMTHCSGATLKSKRTRASRRQMTTATLKITNRSHIVSQTAFMSGHFGGDRTWEAYLKRASAQGPDGQKRS